MRLLPKFNAIVDIQITSADIPGLLTEMNEKGIELFRVKSIDYLTAEILLHRRDFGKIKKLTQRRGDSWKLLRKQGLYWSVKGLLKHPVLLCGILGLFLLTAYLPTRIWFFEVEGNAVVPTKLILEQADACGIRFGVSRSQVRSEKMKNALLQALPQLKWAGINTNGCVATISVRERQEESVVEESNGVSSIVAACDGVVLSCTVTKGNAVCSVGQAVQAGQLLISGYTDCGFSIRAERAQGEVVARTQRSVSVISPTEYQFRNGKKHEIKKYSLLIGKKRINFYKDSGILDGTCDKMVSIEPLTLPGGFILPVSLVTETWIRYDCSTAQWLQEHLGAFASEYVQSQMIAGQILSSRESVREEDGVIVLNAEFACREMIGRVQNEEIIEPNGNDGKIG